MFRVCRWSVIACLVCGVLWLATHAQAAGMSPVVGDHTAQSNAVLSATAGIGQQALVGDTGASIGGVDAASHLPVLAVAVTGVSLFTSLQTVAFIYGLAAVIAFLVALLIKLMAMTLHRL